MSLLFRKKPKGGPNISHQIQETHIWSLQRGEAFCAGERVTAVTYDGAMRIYVIGFTNGELHLYGASPVHHTFRVPPTKGRYVTHIQIAPAAKRLLCLVGNEMIVWSLDGVLQDEPLVTVELPDGTAQVASVMLHISEFIGVSTVHSHALLPRPDGTVHMYDLSRLCESPAKVVPSPEDSEGVVMDLASSPQNVDFLVVATYGSLYLWQFSAHQSLRNFFVPEGKPLRPVCLAFHPHESIFVAGQSDGTLAFWSIDDAVPLFVTTIFELTGGPQQAEGPSEILEPVFKLVWSCVSGRSRQFLHILGGQPAGRRLTTLEFSGTPFSETDQLVPQSSFIYKDYETANTKDFFVLEDSGRILSLNDDGSLLFIPFERDKDTSGSGKGADSTAPIPTDSAYIPYELRSRIVVGQVVTCSLEKLRNISLPGNPHKQIPLAGGGVARPHSSGNGPDPRLARYEAPLLLVALHEDGLIRIDDISPRLLIETEVLESPYPRPLRNLSVDLKAILEEPLLWASVDDTSTPSVQELTFIPEALELYILFKTGDFLVFKYYDDLPMDEPSHNPTESHLVDLSSLTTKSHVFSPRFLFCCKEGACVAFATCEVGFTAVAYANNSLYVLDMRGPKVIFHQNLLSDGDAILKLRFTICRPEPKSIEILCLLVLHASGLVSILTIHKGGSGWTVDKRIEEIPARKSLPLPICFLLVDILSGGELKATAQALSSLLSEKTVRRESTMSYEGGFYRVTVSNAAVRCDIGLSGKNVKTLQLSGTLNAGLIHSDASSALVLFREKGSLTILSLPNLETMANLQDKSLINSCLLTARFLGVPGDFNIKTPSGLEMWSTLSSSTRVKQPEISLPLRAVQGTGQEGGLISWLLGARAMTGEEFDALVAGSNRPPIPSVAVSRISPSGGNDLQEAMAATEERGRLIGSLAGKTDELEHAAEGMAAEAQKLAAKTQSKRRRFGF